MVTVHGIEEMEAVFNLYKDPEAKGTQSPSVSTQLWSGTRCDGR